MIGIAILIVLAIVITASAMAFCNKRKTQDVEGEIITKTNKTLCVILAVPFPLAFMVFAGLLMPHGTSRPWTLAIVVVEAFAVVAAFRLVRLARTPVWIVGMTAFSLHTLILGFTILINIIDRFRL